ncbi:MAG: glycosyltransferase family 9 protein [Mariprofundales bacterium]|nr:glycosyltransferase family 9 protein [Mariprofundales bacterium]
MRALVVVTRYLGDVLLATPLARALTAAGYEVEWLVAPGTEAMVTNQPFAAAVHTLTPSMRGMRETVVSLYQQFDIACVITGSDRATAVSRLVAKRVFALLPIRWQDGWKRHLVTRWVTHDSHSHMVSYNHDLCRLVGAAMPATDVSLEWCSADDATVQQQLGWEASARFVHLHPFARWRYKLWPAEKWQQLIAKLHGAGLRTVITAGPTEAEQAQALAANSALDDDAIRVLAGTLSWAQLAALSARAALYVGLDTANTHLAAGSGTAVVALYGPSDPRIWGPWPKGWQGGRSPYQTHNERGVQKVGSVTLIQPVVGCIPCQREGCAHHRESSSSCLTQLALSTVWQQCEEALA